MDLVELNLSVEPRLYRKHRKRVNTSFIFYDFFFAGSFRSGCPAGSSRKREKRILRLAQGKNDD
jgi:hypothetical protein